MEAAGTDAAIELPHLRCFMYESNAEGEDEDDEEEEDEEEQEEAQEEKKTNDLDE